MEERAQYFRYTRADAEEMMMYSIKPWDANAYVSAVVPNILAEY